MEPGRYAPESHGDIFRQVLSQLVSPRPVLVDDYTTQTVDAPEAFDLVTFPEAFAPAQDLLDTLKSLERMTTLGCVHVGLRPTVEPGQHLFSVTELRDLVDDLLALPSVACGDLASFRRWFARQVADSMFNVGCLFAKDVNGLTRICLHPKLIRAEVESSPLPEYHMSEADLLTIVTLHPSDKQHLSITIQPLICSDALFLQTDRGTSSPLFEVNREANCFDDPPDHIDVVSLATCTPQLQHHTGRYREWHQAFRDAFIKAANEGGYTRHRFTTFVLSNFREIGKPAGLSGVFQPIVPRASPLHRAVSMSCYGRSKRRKGDNGWSVPDEAPPKSWSSRAFVAGLDPFADRLGDAAVRIFGFELPSMIRDNSLWSPPHGPVRCEVTVASWRPGGELAFSKWQDAP